jgi:WD40 repeat protein
MASKARKLKEDASKKAAHLQEKLEAQVRILDPENKAIDRTPQLLLKPSKTHGVVKKGVIDRRTSQTTGEGSQSVSRTSHSEDRSVSQLESSTSSRDDLSTSTPDEESTTNVLDDSSDSAADRSTSVYDRNKSAMSSSDAQSIAEGGRDKKADDTGAAAAKPTAPAKPKEMTVEERRWWGQQEVVITLTETPTIILFSHQDETVSKENAEEVAALQKKNARYQAFCEARAGGESGGKYQERGITTLNDPSRCVRSGVVPPQMKNSGGLQVTTWKLYDEMLAANEEETEQDDMGAAALGGEGEEEAVADDGGDGGGDDDNEDGVEDNAQDGEGKSKGKTSKTSTWMSSPSLLETVMVVERAVVSNVFEELQLAYRGIQMEKLVDHLPQEKETPSSPTSIFGRTRRDQTLYAMAETEAEKQRNEEKEKQKEASERTISGAKPKSKILWRFGDAMTKGKNVSCLSWNRKNIDILAAGYGEYGVPGAAGALTPSVSAANGTVYSGFVCCWSLKNPCAPERVIKIESDAGVSAMHFSSTHPSLLAVGNTDGTLALYDVRKHGNSPALKTTVSTGQHTGTIWEVKWVEKAKDRTASENLISISADGHVMEWSIKKGLERTADLMKLKRQPAPTGEGASAYAKSGAKEALLSRQSGGMCFDMNWEEPLTYVVGTEDGTVHRCTKSQNENFLLDYTPHAEPVYRIRWSPFHHEYFLTCSADWTARLYHWDRADYVSRFDSNNKDAIHDICWSPRNSTLFAAATAKGRVDVWDLSDTNSPADSLSLGKSLNCLLFAEQDSPLLTVGDVDGFVTVVKLNDAEFEGSALDAEGQKERFRQVIKEDKVL